VLGYFQKNPQQERALKKSDFVTLNPVLMNISIISGSHNPLKYLDAEMNSA
jgi:hypothetical protein